jgi:hypothetical protein
MDVLAVPLNPTAPAAPAGRPPSRRRGWAASRIRLRPNGPAGPAGTCRSSPARRSCRPPARQARRYSGHRRRELEILVRVGDRAAHEFSRIVAGGYSRRGTMWFHARGQLPCQTTRFGILGTLSLRIAFCESAGAGFRPARRIPPRGYPSRFRSILTTLSGPLMFDTESGVGRSDTAARVRSINTAATAAAQVDSARAGVETL